MEIAERKQHGVVILSLHGRLDASNAGTLETKALALVDAGERRLVIECSQLDYISSAGLRVLLVTAKRLTPAAGAVVLSGLKAPIKEVLDIAGFSSIFKIYRTVDDALAGFQ